ncbi:hypothetical protein JG687_00015067 [Phytophthora cactorum]|uniref:Uncharacterized protein n=1 Tax=Phytophthora cactorum TaxID=29920 RepID=A0A8T1TX75_9STRA|nr:hypothetical protein JG687_00015067 [Phytophthora cactorum]
MAYARTEVDYALNRDEFKTLTCRNGSNKLWDYLGTNWDELGRIAERVTQTIKFHFTMHSSLEALLWMQRHIEKEYRAQVEMPWKLRDASYSEEMNIVLGMATRWAVPALTSWWNSRRTTAQKSVTDADQKMSSKMDDVVKLKWGCEIVLKNDEQSSPN